MSGNVVRIGDSISCTDHASTGSANVFVNGLPVVHSGASTTTGHGCFPPTIFIGPWSSTVFVNGHNMAIKNVTKIMPHRCGKHTHDGVVITGSTDVYIET